MKRVKMTLWPVKIWLFYTLYTLQTKLVTWQQSCHDGRKDYMLIYKIHSCVAVLTKDGCYDRFDCNCFMSLRINIMKINIYLTRLGNSKYFWILEFGLKSIKKKPVHKFFYLHMSLCYFAWKCVHICLLSTKT